MKNKEYKIGKYEIYFCRIENVEAYGIMFHVNHRINDCYFGIRLSYYELSVRWDINDEQKINEDDDKDKITDGELHDLIADWDEWH